MSNAEDRIAAAEARKREAEELRRQAEESFNTPERRAEQIERQAEDEEALAKAISDHGADRVGHVETDMGRVILKRPDPTVFRWFQDRDEVKMDDIEYLVQRSRVYPDPDRFDRICRELPATLARCARVCSRLAGVREEEIRGKS